MSDPPSFPDGSADQVLPETTLSAPDVCKKPAEEETLHKLEQELTAANHMIGMLETVQVDPLDFPKATEDTVMKSDKTSFTQG